MVKDKKPVLYYIDGKEIYLVEECNGKLEHNMVSHSLHVYCTECGKTQEELSAIIA